MYLCIIHKRKNEKPIQPCSVKRCVARRTRRSADPPHPQPTALSPDGAPVPGAEGFGKDIRGFCDWSVGEQRPVCMALSVMPHVPDHQKGYVILAFFVTSSF